MNCSSFTAVFMVQTTEATTLKKQKLTVLFGLWLTQPDLQVSPGTFVAWLVHMRYESPSVRPRFKPKWLLWYKRMSPACDISSFQLWCCYLLCSWWFQTATNISPVQELTALEAESSQVYLYRPKITLPQRDLLSLQRPLPYIHLAWLQIRRNSFPDIFVSEKREKPWSVYKKVRSHMSEPRLEGGEPKVTLSVF